MSERTLVSRCRSRLRRAAHVGLLLFAACADVGSGSGHLDAAAIARLAARSPHAVLLLFEPTDALACGAEMPRWLTVRRQVPDRVAILLTRAPSKSEAVLFARYRIPVDGVIRRGVLPKTGRGGQAFIYSAGRLSGSGRLRDQAFQATLSRELAR
jgi:hypothetical protein